MKLGGRMDGQGEVSYGEAAPGKAIYHACHRPVTSGAYVTFTRGCDQPRALGVGNFLGILLVKFGALHCVPWLNRTRRYTLLGDVSTDTRNLSFQSMM